MRIVLINAAGPGALEETARRIGLPPIVVPVPISRVVVGYCRGLGYDSGEAIAVH